MAERTWPCWVSACRFPVTERDMACPQCGSLNMDTRGRHRIRPLLTEAEADALVAKVEEAARCG